MLITNWSQFPYLKSTNHIKDFNQLLDWTQFKVGQVQNYIDSMNRLIEPFNLFYGKPGEKSDLNGLLYVARSYSKLYSSFLVWGIEIKSTIVPEDFKKFLSAFSKLPSMLIDQIEEYPKKSLEIIDQFIDKEKNGENLEGTTVSLTLNLTIDDDIQLGITPYLHIFAAISVQSSQYSNIFWSSLSHVGTINTTQY